MGNLSHDGGCPLFESRHFAIDRLADGVFAAIHKPGSWAISNAGIVDLGDFTLIFDTFMTIQAAEDLQKAAEQLTESPVKIVVNSHYHNDHIWGNQVFGSQALILSSAATRSLFMTRGKEEVDWYSENSASELETLRTQYENEIDHERKAWVAIWMSYYEGLVETMPALTVRLPDLTFDKNLEIHGADRSVKLIAYPDAHTPNDTAMLLPDDDILFLSDLLFVDTHPFLADGDPDNLLITCDQIAAYNASMLVPGHGPAGTKDDLRQMQAYIQYCRETVVELHTNGQPVEAIGEQVIPELYQEWDFPNFYAANLRYYYHHLAPDQREV